MLGKIILFCSSFLLLSSTFGTGVSLYDYGLKMNIATYQLPAGWKVNQKIVTDLYNDHRFYSDYRCDFLGPRGEVISNVAPIRFSAVLGQPLQQAWQVALQQRLAQFGKFQLGPRSASRYYRHVFPQLAHWSPQVFAESYVTGYRNGQAFEGICIGIIANGMTGQFTAQIILAPKGKFNSLIQTLQQINASKRDNPQYQSRITQLNQQKNQRVSARHQAFMNQQRVIYNQHRARLAAIRSTSSSSTVASGNAYGTYSVQDAYNDHIKGTTRFDDEYLGYRVPVDGQYDRWFSDGLGHYLGSNDPSFDPASLGGSWQQVQPVR